MMPLKFQAKRVGPQGAELSFLVDGGPEAKRYHHDIAAAVNAFKIMIDLERSRTTNPSERDLKKFSQLDQHVARLEEMASWIHHHLRD